MKNDPGLKKITANLIVASVEASLAFWERRLGFARTVSVPEAEGAKTLGFVILVREDVELMLQSRASLARDVPPLAEAAPAAVLYIEVADLRPIRKALAGWPEVVPERTTFYGAREIIVRDPDGHAVFFSAHTGAA
jgi:catechol 2,3-dioxygenase-like lactoylglutathione lyase family enzyme